MIIRLMLVGTLALAAPAVALPEATAFEAASLVSPGTVSGAQVAADPRPAADGFTEIAVVVPAVDRAGTPGAPRSPQVAGDVVAADRLVSGQRVQTAVIETEEFQTLGLTWPAEAEADVVGLGAQVRTRAAGEWSGWLALDPSDGGADAGTADAAHEVRGGTDAIWVAAADAVQLSFAATPEGGPADLSLALVSSADVPAIEAAAAVGVDAVAPAIITRAQWGASPPVCTPDVASRLVGAVVHHTAGSNGYATLEQAMQQIRNDQRYHIEGRGWCDIGYNFIVDRWGNIYEGRANSLTQPVIGVHAGGFNTGTVGISMLGNYSTVNPPAATQEAVSAIAAWRLRQYHLDPTATMTYYTLGGENSKFPAGTTVTLPVMFAHRDVANTACPGQAGYVTMDGLRARARQFESPAVLSPSISPNPAAVGATVTFRAATLSNVDWRLEISDARTDALVASSIGYAQEAFGGVVATWDGRTGSGVLVGPGEYAFTLRASEAGSGQAIPTYRGTVVFTGRQEPPPVDPVPLVGDLRFVPLTPARVLDTRTTFQALGAALRVDVVVAGVAGVPADAKAVALNITAVSPSAITHLRAWPAGQARPNASVLNADPRRSATAAGTVLGVGGEGKISLWNDAGSTHVVVDVTGYYTTTGTGRYGQLPTALRVMDTRVEGGQMSDGQRRTVTIAGRGGVPLDAQAVVLNATSVASRGNGYVSVVPTGAEATETSTVNHLPGADVANRAMVSLVDGKVDVLMGGAAADVVLDVVGWYGPGGTATFTPVVPARAFDTRVSGGALGAGATRTFTVGTPTGLPSAATSVLMTITATQQTAVATYLTAWPVGTPRPATSDLNTGRGRDQANGVVVGVGTGGAIQVYNNLGSVHVIGDVLGYFR